MNDRQLAYTYDDALAAGPLHAPSRIADGARGGHTDVYHWDANGNQTAVGIEGSHAGGVGNGRTVAWDDVSRATDWDDENRAIAMFNGHDVTRFAYAASGERSVKMSGTSASGHASLYPSAFVSQRGDVRDGVFTPGVTTIHVYAGDTRVARNVVTGDGTGTGRPSTAYW